MKITGTNGIQQVRLDNQRVDTEKLAAVVDYVAMMADVEIPTEETEEADEQA
jgi:hypothetical protein